MNYFAIPENFDIHQHLKAHPPTAIKPFKKDHLLYILSLIYDGIIRYKGRLRNSDFVPLNARILQSYVRNYNQYLEYLIETGVFISDGQYITKKKSTGFHYSEKYRTASKEIEITDFVLSSKLIKAERNQNKSAEGKLPFLAKWFSGDGLRIDEQAAFAILSSKYEVKLRQKRSPFPFNNAKVKLTPKQIADHSLSSWKASIKGVNQEVRTFTIDDKGGRLYTCLTSLSKDFRKFVSYKEESLVHIDIANSQPYFSTLLLNPAFWETHFLKQSQINAIEKELRKSGIKVIEKMTAPPKLPSLKIKKGFKSISSIYQYIYDILMIVKIEDIQCGKELSEYRNIVSDGKLYQYLGEAWTKQKNRTLDKGKIKETVFGIFFSENNILGWLEREETKLFNDLFPIVTEVFRKFKWVDYTLLSILLQNLESQTILHFVCPAIAQKCPKIPIWTIHDSVVTTVGNEGLIKAIMEQELFEVTGLKPTLRTEYWI